MLELLTCSYRKFILFSCALFWVLFPLDPSQADNTFTFDSGYGLDDTRLLRLSLSISNDWRHPIDNGWYWSRSWEGNLSYWYLYKKFRKREDNLLELGVTPNFRLERDHEWGRPYLEAGLGFRLLSKKWIGGRNLGGTLHFGTHAGFGLRFGRNKQYDLAWRYEHISNAGFRSPNPGIDFSMIRFGLHW